MPFLSRVSKWLCYEVWIIFAQTLSYCGSAAFIRAKSKCNPDVAIWYILFAKILEPLESFEPLQQVIFLLAVKTLAGETVAILVVHFQCLQLKKLMFFFSLEERITVAAQETVSQCGMSGFCPVVNFPLLRRMTKMTIAAATTSGVLKLPWH